jgi:hypothetical protein
MKYSSKKHSISIFPKGDPIELLISAILREPFFILICDQDSCEASSHSTGPLVRAGEWANGGENSLTQK